MLDKHVWIVLSASAALKTTLVGIKGSCSLSYRRTRVSGSILEFEWVSLTEIILSWSLINILIYTLKYHVVQRSWATPHFFIFWFNFCYKESVNCNFFEWWQKYVSRLSEDPLKIMLCTLADFFCLCSVKSLYLTFFNGMLYFLANTDLYIQFKLILHNYNKDWKIINLVPNTKYWFSSLSGWWKLLFPLD